MANTDPGVTGRNPVTGDVEKAADDLLWGVKAIAAEAGLKPAQIYNMIESGALDGVVAKLSHKVIVGSKRGLRNLPSRRSKARARREGKQIATEVL
jgi:hypothetical protein